MEDVRSGRRDYVSLDLLHRESLTTLLQRHDVPPLAPHEIEHLVCIWHSFTPWSDTVEGLYRLKRRYITGTLSNGNIGLMTRLSKHAGLPWDVILGAEVVGNYKPLPEVYLGSADALNLEPRECMLVAAHNDDLAAASDVGYRTAFVLRPTEYGSRQSSNTAATSAWDIVTDSFHGLADALGCPRY